MEAQSATGRTPMIERDWLTVQEVRERVKVEERQIYKWIKEGQLPSTVMPSRRVGYRIDLQELEELMNRLKVVKGLNESLSRPQ